ncbi:hypothetical protein QFZ65_000598 [Arthrobacter sp. B3I9]|uniref:hypothetical protein n=1 Tax=Arthrobacter sp. B3I9 TaxID=3042270 RepID=UPI00278F300D|nr:hypothetical protein [Arthrobacter sp. B3I9]MDQ0848660.1 hypothetical protein [Arthrobacter sp. B3I9]
MAAEEVGRVRTGAELSVGDEIEAWHNGKLFHRGCVSQTVASMDLVWIRDARTGARRLIDVEALVILRAPTPADTARPATATDSAKAAATLGTAGTATLRTAGPATATAGTASPATVAAAKGGARGVPARPASHVPLFHAPGLAT